MSRRLNILIFHRVLDHQDPMLNGEVDINQFDLQMSWVKRFYNVLDLNIAIDMLLSNTLPSRALCVTFDDGYKDNYTNALPILKKHGLPATFFIATGFLNGGIMWNDVVIETLRNTKLKELDLSEFGLDIFNISENRADLSGVVLKSLKYLSFEKRALVIKALPELLDSEAPVNLMMTDDDVKQLHGSGMTIGGHTENHPILARLSREQAKREIESGKQYLEKITEDKIQLFAYPNGIPGQDYKREHVEIIKELGFKGAVSTAWGAATHKSDIFQLPRFTPWDKSTIKYLLRLEKMRRSPSEDTV